MTHRRWGDVEGDLNPSKSVYGKKAKKKKPKWQRDLLAGPCAYCGRPADTLDHKIPKSRGGKSSQENTVGACRRCNGEKKDMSYDEFLSIEPCRLCGTRPFGRKRLHACSGQASSVKHKRPEQMAILVPEPKKIEHCGHCDACVKGFHDLCSDVLRKMME